MLQRPNHADHADHDEALSPRSGPPRKQGPVLGLVALYKKVRASYRPEIEAVAAREGGIVAVGVFLFFGAIAAFLAATTLLWPGTILDHMWALNPAAYVRLAPLGKAVGIPFLALGAALAVTGTGWFRRRVWGWGLAVIIITIQVLGDLVNVCMGDLLRGGVGLTLASALLFYLVRPKVRAAFRTSRVLAGP